MGRGCVSRRSAQRLCAVPLDGFGCELMRLYLPQSRKQRNHKLEKGYEQDYGEWSELQSVIIYREDTFQGQQLRGIDQEQELWKHTR